MAAIALTVAEYGNPSGIPLLALHGGGNTHDEWARLATLRIPHRRWVCPDLLGHGASPRIPPWTLAHHVESLLTTMDQLELAQVDVIGMSFGARIAVELCREAPERVRSVVQLDPPLMTPREWSQYVRRHPPPPREYDDIDAAIHDTGLSPDALQEARRVMLAGLERAPGGRLRKRAHPDALVGMYRSLAEEPAGQFGAFGGRVLTLVAGAHDIHTAAGLAAREKELGMRLTLVTIEGSGHAVMWHNLAEVADHVGRFLADTAVD